MTPFEFTGGALSRDELEATLPAVQSAPADRGHLVGIIIRPDRDLRVRADSCVLTPEEGIPGDRWAKHCNRRLPDGRLNPDTQLTLMNTRFLAPLAGSPERWPLAGDNLLVDLDLSEPNLPVGQHLRVGEAVIEISAEPHTGCAKFAKRFGAEALSFVNSPEGRRLRLRGVNARVVESGRIQVGDSIRKMARAGDPEELSADSHRFTPIGESGSGSGSD
jgi:MOSC domain-containing protein YiiM